MAHKKRYMGIDIGSVSLNIVVADEAAGIETSIYRRTEGQPMATLLDALQGLGSAMDAFDGVVATGSGRKLVGRVLGVPDVNEIVTQATAAFHFYPQVHTIIEIGGQDSKLVFVDRDARTGGPLIIDHVL
ncbi:MAG: BadF/BadG/BcrA/BcrD ATPase family protein, partial [Thermodesulfobacteriota bacterium]|nr:BadF/BadG/BcrA/BcrD ATPase family protein [Thermodesulfobacteriota bacterium]